MVGREATEYEVVLTPQFLEDLEACVGYVGEVLGSPIAARKMYETIKKKVFALGVMPTAATRYVSPGAGTIRYKVSYNRYDVHYSVDEDAHLVRVLGIKHQLQLDEWVG